MSMLKALRGAEQNSTKTNIVNADIKVVEDVDGKTSVITDTSPQGPSHRPKFKPVSAELRAAFDAQAMAENEALARANTPPSNNFDLVGDDMGATPEKRQRAAASGRPRLYPSSAARQQAYRDRKKQPNA